MVVRTSVRWREAFLDQLGIKSVPHHALILVRYRNCLKQGYRCARAVKVKSEEPRNCAGLAVAIGRRDK